MQRILTIMILILFGFSLKGEEIRKDSIIVSLLTCDPGAEIYELCGHEAVRVRGMLNGERIDSVWNYGVFDFSEPNFVYRFVKGETDYRLAGYPTSWFMPEYVAAGRRVVEQDLNLSAEEAGRLHSLLREESKPENCKYRYNYVRDNCATRILWRLDTAASSRVIYPDDVRYGTFRKEMRAYHRNYPWYQFGIDLALGGGLDRPLRGRDEMFVPVEMMRKVGDAHFEDGRKLVSSTRILNDGNGDVTLPATPWYLTPMAAGCLILLLSLIAASWEIWRKKIISAIYVIWFGICGIAGCVVFFLVFVSEHEATSPNLLLIWLNPLQLLMALCVLSGRLRYGAVAMAWYNIVATGSLLVVWPFQAQSANPAVFPMMGATVVLAIAYAMASGQKESELSSRNEKNNNNGALRSGHNERGRAGGTRRSSTATARGGNRR